MKISNMKKTWRYHHFTQVHQNHDYPLYCSRDMARDRCNCYFHFELYFSLLPPPPPPLTAQKWKFHNKEKIAWRYHHFTHVHQKSWSYVILFLRYGMSRMQLFFILGYLFPFYTLTAQNNQISKNKKHSKISSLYSCVPKIMIRWCMVPEIWCVTNGRMEGRTNGKSGI